MKRYCVENICTGEQFGNHTYNEAVTRMNIMIRNWLYKEKFKIVELV